MSKIFLYRCLKMANIPCTSTNRVQLSKPPSLQKILLTYLYVNVDYQKRIIIFSLNANNTVLSDTAFSKLFQLTVMLLSRRHKLKWRYRYQHVSSSSNVYSRQQIIFTVFATLPLQFTHWIYPPLFFYLLN
jgi:hypothetical protein